jgi:5-methylcytosine-specific restriction endonuclease McrA
MLNSLKILILNYSFEPLQFCSARRGLVMVLSGRAEQIECDGYVVRSPSLSLQVPTVIRVLNLVKRKVRKNVSFSKKNILRRDKFTCQYCGDREHPLTVDHVIPKSRGGKTIWTNVVVACKPCNMKKGSRTSREANMRLGKKPLRPDFNFHQLVVPVGPTSHVESWMKYLPKSFVVRTSMN